MRAQHIYYGHTVVVIVTYTHTYTQRSTSQERNAKGSLYQTTSLASYIRLGRQGSFYYYCSRVIAYFGGIVGSFLGIAKVMLNHIIITTTHVLGLQSAWGFD